MEPREAQEIIRMVESSWLCDFGPAGRELWRQMLEPYDAELATRAVAEMARHPLPGNRARPTVADLRAVIVRLARTEHELERAGVAYRNPHTMRHTFATRLIRAGARIENVQLLLGHTSIRTTIDLYGHLDVEDARADLRLLEIEV